MKTFFKKYWRLFIPITICLITTLALVHLEFTSDDNIYDTYKAFRSDPMSCVFAMSAHFNNVSAFLIGCFYTATKILVIMLIIQALTDYFSWKN